MKGRSLYYFLLRLHPACFRKQYEDQMMWIFDESVASSGTTALLLDAFLSLIRQWVLRSGYWRDARPPIAIDGATVLAEQLRRNAETLHRRAWRLNFVWLAGSFTIYFLIPLSSHWNPIVLMVFISVCFKYSNNRRGRRHPEQGTLSIRSWPDARTMYRKQLEGKRDGLRLWNGRTTTKIGGGVLLGLMALLTVIYANLHYSPYLNIDRVRLWESFSGVVILTGYSLFMRRCNERAARAIQQEIDAMDASSAPQSV